MRRQTTSRVLLSILLLWQLVAGALTHAHGLSPQTLQAAADHDVASHESVHHETMTHEHCADMQSADMQMDMSATVARDVSLDASPDVSRDTQSMHSSSQSDCCKSSVCQCPCIQAVAVAIALPQVAAARPNMLELLEPIGSILDAGVSGLFRPPI